MYEEKSKRIATTILIFLVLLFVVVVYGVVDSSLSAVKTFEKSTVNIAKIDSKVIDDESVALGASATSIGEEYTLSTPLSDFSRIIVNSLCVREGQIPNEGAIYTADDMTDEDVACMLSYAASNHGLYFFAKEEDGYLYITSATAQDFITINMGISSGRVEDIFEITGGRENSLVKVNGKTSLKAYVKLNGHLADDEYITENITILDPATGQEREGQITFQKLSEWSNVFNYRFVSVEF